MAEQDLINLIESGFKALGARIDETRAEMRQEFAKVNFRLDRVEQRLDGVETDVRRVFVQVESLPGKIDLVVEGILNIDQKLDRHIGENNRQFDAIEDHFDLVHSAVRHSHVFGERLDARVTTLESLRH